MYSILVINGRFINVKAYQLLIIELNFLNVFWILKKKLAGNWTFLQIAAVKSFLKAPYYVILPLMY